MFNLRHKRTTRDREQGLVFEWRLPVANTVRFLSAGLVVAGIAAGLAATVRVRVGASPRQTEARGSLVLVPHGEAWSELEWMALEAGPRPRRADPVAEPAVRDALARSLSTATTPGYVYAPALREVTVQRPATDLAWEEAGGAHVRPMVLPPLPVLDPPSQNPPMASPARVIVLSGGELRAMPPREAPPAAVARGSRYLLHYDGDGRVMQATTLTAPAAPAGGTAPELTGDASAWLRGVSLTGGPATGGWAAVEITGGL